MTLLSVHQLTKQFQAHSPTFAVTAFERISLTVEAGAFVLLAGNHAVGKAALLRCLYRTYRPTSGRVVYQSLDGAVDLASADEATLTRLRRTEIGYVGTGGRVGATATVLETVVDALRLAGLPAEQAYTEARTALAAFGVSHTLWPVRLQLLSAELQHRVVLARVLAAPRRLLLLDDAGARLNPNGRVVLWQRLAALKRAGTAIVAAFPPGQAPPPLVDAAYTLAAPMEWNSLPPAPPSPFAPSLVTP